MIRLPSPVTGGSGRNAGRFLGLKRGWRGGPSHELLSDEQRLEGQKAEQGGGGVTSGSERESGPARRHGSAAELAPGLVGDWW